MESKFSKCDLCNLIKKGKEIVCRKTHTQEYRHPDELRQRKIHGYALGIEQGHHGGRWRRAWWRGSVSCTP